MCGGARSVSMAPKTKQLFLSPDVQVTTGSFEYVVDYLGDAADRRAWRIYQSKHNLQISTRVSSVERGTELFRADFCIAAAHIIQS